MAIEDDTTFYPAEDHPSLQSDRKADGGDEGWDMSSGSMDG